MMCYVYDARDYRHYTRNCSVVKQLDLTRQRSFTSEYDGIYVVMMIYVLHL